MPASKGKKVEVSTGLHMTAFGTVPNRKNPDIYEALTPVSDCRKTEW